MTTTQSESVNDAELTSFIERIERLNEEKQTISDDIKDVYTEAAGRGLDKKIIRTIVRRRQKDKDELEQEETLIDLYENAIARKLGK